jgi:2-amino-4-hydroxy-6-hydroxymethyldihydropteridine diphosphokinase
MMSTAYLGIGSNIDARKNITSAIAGIREAFDRVDLSPAYQTASFGFEGADFINLVAKVETDLDPLDLKEFLHTLEDRHQRNREAPKFSDRTLDIDILLYDDLYLIGPALELPHGEILSAAYVLKPLADLAPDLLHPVCRKTISELWKAFSPQDAKLKLIQL